jgi:hypothetical protein
VRLPLDPGARVLNVLLGLVVLLGGAGLSLLFGSMVFFREVTVTGAGLFGLFSLLFALAAWWGGTLALRGVRGFRLVSQQALRRDRALRNPSSLAVLAFVMVSAGLLFLMTEGRPWFDSRSFGLTTFVWYFIISELWLLPSVAVHELGHAATAWCVGIPWTSLRIGPFEVVRTLEGRRRVRWHADGLGPMLGLARFDARAPLEAPDRFAWVVLGGPVANALLALGFVVVARTLGGTTPGSALGLSALLWAGAILNAFLAVFNLLPRRLSSGMDTDGAQLLKLWRFQRQSPGALLLARIQVASLTLRPREWNLSAEALLHAARTPGETPEMTATHTLYALCILLDREEVAAARALLNSPGPDVASHARLHREFLLQDALMRALDEADPTRARALLVQVESLALPGEPFYPRLAEAAVLLAEGRTDEARTALTQWEQAARAEGCWNEFITGNLWAFERLHAALGVPSQEAPLKGDKVSR